MPFKPIASGWLAVVLILGHMPPSARCDDASPIVAATTQKIIADPHRKTNVQSLAEPVEFPILSAEEFRRVYGGSLKAVESDTNSRLVVNWVKCATALPGPQEPAGQAATARPTCGETFVGQAMAILLNREMPNSTREAHFQELSTWGMPRLEEGYFESKHFRFYYNTDPQRPAGDAVTDLQISKLAAPRWRKAWGTFEKAFRTPPRPAPTASRASRCSTSASTNSATRA